MHRFLAGLVVSCALFAVPTVVQATPIDPGIPGEVTPSNPAALLDHLQLFKLPYPATSGTATTTFDPVFYDNLEAHGVEIQAVAPAYRAPDAPREIEQPIGWMHSSYTSLLPLGLGYSGGFAFVNPATGASVSFDASFFGPDLDGFALRANLTVNGVRQAKQTPLFGWSFAGWLADPKIGLSAGGLALGNFKVDVTREMAAMLNETLGTNVIPGQRAGVAGMVLRLLP